MSVGLSDRFLSGGIGVGLRNKSLARAYTITGTPDVGHPDNTVARLGDTDSTWVVAGGELTDGYIPPPGFSSAGYVGWNSTSPVFTFDLSIPEQIDEVVIIGTGDGASGVYPPSAVKIESSPDNSTWTTEINKTSLGTGTGTANRWIVRLSVNKERQYWKITLTYQTQWLFVGEIQLWGP